MKLRNPFAIFVSLLSKTTTISFLSSARAKNPRIAEAGGGALGFMAVEHRWPGGVILDLASNDQRAHGFLPLVSDKHQRLPSRSPDDQGSV